MSEAMKPYLQSSYALYDTSHRSLYQVNFQYEYSNYTGYTQKNGAVSKVNKKFIFHPTRAQRTPSAAATVQVSHALPAVPFSCLLRGRGTSFQDDVASGKGLEKTHHAWGVFSKPFPDATSS